MNDSNDFSIEKCQAFAEANFQNLQHVYNFLEKYKNSITSILPKPEHGHRDVCIKGLWSRMYFWLSSLNKLNATRDFQAFASANRALLEIMVDLTLLHKDNTNSSGWKMWWWSLSEKLKGSQQIIRFFDEQELSIPDAFKENVEFIKREESNVIHMRNALWNGKHPNRWTGKVNLFDELKEVDDFLGKSIIDVLDMNLAQYYRTQYRKMNWYIHSGVASFWNLPKESFPILSAFFMKSCADFAILSTQIVINDFGLNEHLPNYMDELENLHYERMDSLIQNLSITIPKFE